MARESAAMRIQKRVAARQANFLAEKRRLKFCQDKFQVAKDLRRLFDIKWYISRAFYPSSRQSDKATCP
jgi:hypothetical protein